MPVKGPSLRHTPRSAEPLTPSQSVDLSQNKVRAVECIAGLNECGEMIQLD